MDFTASSPLPGAEGTLEEEAQEAEGGSSKLGSFLRIGREPGTGRHRTSFGAVHATHALALSAHRPRPESPASRTKNGYSVLHSVRQDLTSDVCSYGYFGHGADAFQEPPQASHVLVQTARCASVQPFHVL